MTKEQRLWLFTAILMMASRYFIVVAFVNLVANPDWVWFPIIVSVVLNLGAAICIAIGKRRKWRVA